MTAYYNENEPYAAQWLKNLIDAGHIAPGIVDNRSIADVRPYDLKGFTQLHFFAGIGIWSGALRTAGWPDDRPIWTGSCPCQPFSGAGDGKGMADSRHLWPVWYDLIRECEPGTIIGEQVASRLALDWLDHVQTDMEATNYAFAAVDICAAGIGAPHWRQRLWWVAHAASERQPGVGGHREEGTAKSSGPGQMAEPSRARWGTGRGTITNGPNGRDTWGTANASRGARGLADTDDRNTSTEGIQRSGEHRQQPQDCGAGDDHGRPGPVNGFWANADWIRCTDGKWRPVEPGTQPLAHGYPQRVGKLRANGNAICKPLAVEFIKTIKEII